MFKTRYAQITRNSHRFVRPLDAVSRHPAIRLSSMMSVIGGPFSSHPCSPAPTDHQQ